MCSRRLVQDFETLPASSEAFIYFSQAMLLSRRLAGAFVGAGPSRTGGLSPREPARRDPLALTGFHQFDDPPVVYRERVHRRHFVPARHDGTHNRSRGFLAPSRRLLYTGSGRLRLFASSSQGLGGLRPGRSLAAPTLSPHQRVQL